MSVPSALTGQVFTDNREKIITWWWWWWWRSKQEENFCLWIHQQCSSEKTINKCEYRWAQCKQMDVKWHTCCSHFCLSASSCWENSLAWLSLRVLEWIKSSSTFSIWSHERKQLSTSQVCVKHLGWIPNLHYSYTAQTQYRNWLKNIFQYQF